MKVLYWTSTLLLSVFMLMGVIRYFVDNENIAQEFIKLGYPTYLIYFMAITKGFGVIVILYRKMKVLTEWAYAGFFFNLFLAFLAHLMVKDDEVFMPLIPMVFLAVSYFSGKKVFDSN